MARKSEKKALGSGLSELLADMDMDGDGALGDATSSRADLMVPIEKLRANPDQPRRDFDKTALAELTASVAKKGVIQPLIVRPDPRLKGGYEIVAGERRWRAAQAARLHDVPIVVRELDDTEVLEIAIIENVQRADLNPIEEALGYRQLMDRFGHTQERMAEALGKSRSHIANLLRLLNLPDPVQNMLRNGKLSSGHARALITAEDPLALATQVVSKGLSVRQTEDLARNTSDKTIKKQKLISEKDADTRAVEDDLTAALGLKVSINHKPGSENGELKITYKSLDDLDGLCQLLSK